MTSPGTPHFISDASLFDEEDVSQERDLLELIANLLPRKIGELGCVRVYTGFPNALLVTTGFYEQESQGDRFFYAPLFWIRRAYWYSEVARVVRLSWFPVVGNPGVGTIPAYKQNTEYEFSCLEHEVCWVIFKLAQLVAVQGLNKDIPEEHSNWLESCELRPSRELNSNILLEDGSINSYLWTVSASKAYEDCH